MRIAGAAAAVLAGAASLAFVPQLRGVAPAKPAGAHQQAAGRAATPLSDFSQPLSYPAPPANNSFWFSRAEYPPWQAHPARVLGPLGAKPGTRHQAQADTPAPTPTPTPSQGGTGGSGTGGSTGGGGNGGGGGTKAVCMGSGGGGMVPQNYAAIVNFLAAHGYTGYAAAGVAGNIYQESGGNPESVGSGGGGLIGWTPLPAGFVTGNPAADLQTQLAALLTFNRQWSQYLPALNAATSAAAAADIYMTDFERPGIPAAGNREAAATAVAAACGI